MSQLELDLNPESPRQVGRHLDEKVLDVFGAARYLKLSPKTIRCYARSRKIPAKKVGSQWRFLKSLLDRWLAGEYPKGEQKPAGVVSTALEDKSCRYLNGVTSIGSISGTKDKEYEKLLEL